MPNLLASPRKWKNKALLLKSETGYGVDAIPTAVANWIEARNLVISPFDSDKVQRNIELPYLGNAGEIIVGIWTKISFDFAMAPSGTAGVAPKWSPVMLGAGTAETITATTSVAYNLVSSAFGSLSAYLNIDGMLQKLLGMRGNIKCSMAAGGIPMGSFSGEALYTTPSTLALPAVTRTGWMLEEAVNSVNTGPIVINGVNLAFSTFDWDFGNKIERIDLPGPQKEVSITNRDATASVTILAPDLATFNPFVLAEAGTTILVSQTHGSAGGKKAKSDLNARITGIEKAQIKELDGWKLTLKPASVVGNDEIALTCL